MKLHFEKMDKFNAGIVAEWKYNSPYEFYNVEESQFNLRIDELLNPANSYYTVKSENLNLIGYCGFGPDGQVPGGDYSSIACDVSVGLDPELTGKGNGTEFFQSILDFALSDYKPQLIRLTVAKFNLRAIHLYKKLGFQEVSMFYNSFKSRRQSLICYHNPFKRARVNLAVEFPFA